MKMRAIAENKFTDLAQKLNKEIKEYGESELRDLVKDPRETLTLIRRGSLSKTFVLADNSWIEKFIDQWNLLDGRTLEKTFELAYQDVMDKYESIQQKTAKKDGTTTEDACQSELMLMEGVGSFLGKLAKWAILIMQILTLSIGGRGGRGGYGRQASPDDLRILNPYAVFRLTKRLYDTSVAVYNRGRSVP